MTGELLTVKEYAARQGMTEQAAYKQIRAGKLLTVEHQEGGKSKKYIFLEAGQGQAAAADAAGQIPAKSQEEIQREPREGVLIGHAAAQDQTSAAINQAVEALTAQLAEKDKQIERLTELLSQSHQLQAHAQKLLEQGAPQTEQETAHQGGPTADAEEPSAHQSAPKKKTFFAWLFGE